MIEITIKPDSFVCVPVANVSSFKSSLNGFQQFSTLPGSRWAASFTWTNRKGEDARRLRGQLSGLLGQVGTFKIAIPDSLPLGTASGSGVVDGAGQTGTSLDTTGWDINQALLFSAGDWVEIEQQAYTITADASSDDSGNATLQITPPLRKSMSNGSQIVTSGVSFYMRSTKNDVGSANVTPGKIYAVSLEGIEID